MKVPVQLLCYFVTMLMMVACDKDVETASSLKPPPPHRPKAPEPPKIRPTDPDVETSYGDGFWHREFYKSATGWEIHLTSQRLTPGALSKGIEVLASIDEDETTGFYHLLPGSIAGWSYSYKADSGHLYIKPNVDDPIPFKFNVYIRYK